MRVGRAGGLGVAGALAALTLLSAFQAAPTPDFDREIAPLLAKRCLDCHSGPKPKGKLDLTRRAAALRVLTPGDPATSLLWEQIDGDEMPPKKPLPPAERTLLKAWIAAGAAWGSDPVDPHRFTTADRAGYDWWALKPLAVVTKLAEGVANPIDAFVLDGLKAAGLEPSPPADRRTLIRRLSFDLLGLPPAPEEVEAFIADPAADAVERLVDRLLASPHYGERWARHWLDVVRFGESNGFERDLPRDNAWPYRDWVIRALNQDLPFDEFVRLQLAGDVLRPEDPDALVSTGFLVAGPHDTVVPASDAMRKTMQQDELEDLIGTVGQTFLGMTVNCARCHDHKFDPIPQVDYYRLASALSGAQHGERNLADPAAAGRAARVASLAEELESLERPARLAALAGARREAPPKPMAAWNFTEDLRDRVGTLHGTAHGGARSGPEGLVLDGKGWVETTPLGRNLGEKTLEAWVKVAGLKQQGGGVLGVQALDGSFFDAIVFGEQEPGRWMAGSNNFKRTKSFGGPADAEAVVRAVHVAVIYRGDGTIAGYRDGVPYGAPYASEALQLFRAGDTNIVFGLRHSPPGGNKMLAGTIVRATLYDRALTEEEVAASAGTARVGNAELEAQLTPEARERRTSLRTELAKLRKEGTAGDPRKVYAVTPAAPGPMRVLHRGNVKDPGETVSAGGLRALGVSADFGIAPDAPESERRLRLARWITSRENPLFARVAVNRLWHHHFGRGIVDTPNDFGFNGGRPSHPELLDWLAAELVRRDWSLKALHRLIVTSATYRQSSAPRPAALARDAQNRLLWRRSPQRLEAEAIRDAMLQVAGELDRSVGGRGYRDVNSVFFKGTQFYEPLDPQGPEAKRRTLYRFGARGGRSPFLETFDCPDPSTPAPQRAVTTTPLQALSLLNDSFALRMADRLAERVRRESKEDGQVSRMLHLAYGRPASAVERERYTAFIREHGLAAFARVVLNTSEFLYVD